MNSQKINQVPTKITLLGVKIFPVSLKRRLGGSDLVSVMTVKCWILNGFSDLEESVTVNCLLGWNRNLKKIKTWPIYKLNDGSD